MTDTYEATPSEALRRAIVASVQPFSIHPRPSEIDWVNQGFLAFSAMDDGRYAQVSLDGSDGRSMLTMGGYELTGLKPTFKEPAVLAHIAQHHHRCEYVGGVWTVVCDDAHLAAALAALDAIGVSIAAF